MNAIRVHAVGGPEALRYESVADPVPGPGQVCIDVEAIGVNFMEVYHRTGLYQVAFPAIPGSEAAGRIAALGPGVTDLAVGDTVASTSVLGAYAERALAPADGVV